MENEEQIIYGFYEYQYPIYTTKQDAHSELCSPMTVDEANALVKKIVELRYALDQLRRDSMDAVVVLKDINDQQERGSTNTTLSRLSVSIERATDYLYRNDQ